MPRRVEGVVRRIHGAAMHHGRRPAATGRSADAREPGRPPTGEPLAPEAGDGDGAAWFRTWGEFVHT